MIHGGEVYNKKVILDFSVNLNPLGVPDTVKNALIEAVEFVDRYPDIYNGRLSEECENVLNVSKENILFGNGASELFMAIAHAVAVRKAVIPVPSFYGYEYVSEAVGAEILFYEKEQDNNFEPDEGLFSVLTEDVDLLWIANPNNPDGTLLSGRFLSKLLKHCDNNGIIVVVDECFISFCQGENSVIHEINSYRNLIVVRAFTKIFSIPAVRLGYLVSGRKDLVKKIGSNLPEWNLSGFAQAAGISCINEKDYVIRTAGFVSGERRFLKHGLEALSIKVYPGKANFLLVYSEKDLYNHLLKYGILIRDCSNFRGLKKGFYRIAVKDRTSNERLLEALSSI